MLLIVNKIWLLKQPINKFKTFFNKRDKKKYHMDIYSLICLYNYESMKYKEKYE